jgi:hypothetical protein
LNFYPPACTRIKDDKFAKFLFGVHFQNQCLVFGLSKYQVINGNFYIRKVELRNNMRILFVGMSDSIHLVRWINQLDGINWERFLFPIYSVKPHADLKDLTAINGSEIPGFQKNRSLRYMNSSLPYFTVTFLQRIIQKRLKPLQPEVRPSPLLVRALVSTIKRVKPDIIHSMEFQEAGYLTLAAKENLKGKFPKWIATNWGSDIYLFGRLAEHRERVRTVVENCDYYSCECERDVFLAREYGLRGEVLPVFPNTGGFDLEKCKALRPPGNTSGRKIILLKGYQTWAGRALSGLRALARCGDIQLRYFPPDRM